MGPLKGADGPVISCKCFGCTGDRMRVSESSLNHTCMSSGYDNHDANTKMPLVVDGVLELKLVLRFFPLSLTNNLNVQTPYFGLICFPTSFVQ